MIAPDYRWVSAMDPRPRPSHYASLGIGLGNCRCVLVPIRQGNWPTDVTVPPPPMRGRHLDAQVGTELGAACFRQHAGLGWCQGRMELEPDRFAGHPSAAGQELGLVCSECLEEMPCRS